jgi:hypothetical protein
MTNIFPDGQTPSLKAVSFNNITNLYGAIQFQDALGNFIMKINHPHLTGNPLCMRALNMLISFHAVPVFHHVKFTKCNQHDQIEISDTIQAWPEQWDAREQIIPSHFDTILVQTRGRANTEGQGTKGNQFLYNVGIKLIWS